METHFDWFLKTSMMKWRHHFLESYLGFEKTNLLQKHPIDAYYEKFSEKSVFKLI
jgi:hypothetical protein